MATRRTVITAVYGGLLIAAALGAALSSRTEDWAPLPLVGLLFVLAAGSELLNVEIRELRLSGSFVSFVLAMALLGPAPAAALCAACALLDSATARRSFEKRLVNVATYTVFGLAGGLAMQLLVGRFDAGSTDPLWFAAAVFGIFMAANALNFLLIATYAVIALGVPARTLRGSFVTTLPSQFATALLTAAVAFAFGHLGIASVGLTAVIFFVFLYIARTSIQAEERGEELTQRTRELAALQMGLLSTVLQTLSMRDATTARHSAAVARYSREVAVMLGLDERAQDLIHTAGLLHDIGKFILPDSVLFANRKLTDDEWELIKRHPEQSAKLVDRIDGYGPVAEIVLHHHEQYAGGGYPAGIGGEEIPLGARVLSVADTYDVMTSRDSYRRPVSREAALAELRRVAGTQLDPEVVEVFERMILENGVAFSHSDEADFEYELAFERRVIDYARPRLAAESELDTRSIKPRPTTADHRSELGSPVSTP